MTKSHLPVVFDYLELCKYLRDYYEARKQVDTWFSYRYIQSKTGIDPGYLFKIFQNTKPLPQKNIDSFAKLLSLSKREKEYFTLLVLFNKAKSNEQIKLYFEKMLQYKEVTARKVVMKEYEYYRNWYNIALRHILSYYPFDGDYNKLAKQTVPAITAEEAHKGVELLKKLGLVEETSSGKIKVVDKRLSTGEGWHSIAIRKFQKDTIMLAHNALDKVDKDLRDISTMTVTLSEDGFMELREIIHQFRKTIADLVDKQEQPTGAYHINVQMIPIGKHWDGGENEKL